MPLKLSAADAATLANLPDNVRRILTADLESKENARLQAERDQAERDQAEASRAANPITQAIAAMNARVAAQPPGHRSIPAGMSPRDASSYARSFAVQQITAANDRDTAARAAKLAADDAERRQFQAEQAAAVAAQKEIEAQRIAAVEHEHQIQRAIRAMAEDYLELHKEL